MTEQLTTEEVAHVAKLSRLRLSDEQIESYRGQLTGILDHIATLGELDVEEVEPMAHPLDMTNRLDEDREEPALPVDAVLQNAPAVEGPFLAVPKVLGDGGGA